MNDGLCVDPNGDKSWWKNGELHRLDGPAVEWTNGYRSWWIDGKRLTRIQFKKISTAPLRGYHRCLSIDCEMWMKSTEPYCRFCIAKHKKAELAKTRAERRLRLAKMKRKKEELAKKRAEKKAKSTYVHGINIQKVTEKLEYLDAKAKQRDKITAEIERIKESVRVAPKRLNKKWAESHPVYSMDVFNG